MPDSYGKERGHEGGGDLGVAKKAGEPAVRVLYKVVIGGISGVPQDLCNVLLGG